MKKFEDPIENAIGGFATGFKDGMRDGRPSGDERRVLRPWAKVVLWFVLGMTLLLGLPSVYTLLFG